MKRKLLISVFSLVLLVAIGVLLNYKTTEQENKTIKLREQHKLYLENSPFKETLKLSKKERKALGITPNKFFERDWELTMDPATGKPEPQRLFELQENLRKQRLFGKVPGESVTEAWEERGPNNVGGRTRAVMYDPNDVTNKRVFAGGVSGGLWVNDDITNASSTWSEVGIPKNLAISCITYDPNNTDIFYVGTGESYVQGQVNGNGIWKSIDAGVSWQHVFGGVTGETDNIPGTGVIGNAKIEVSSPVIISGDYYGFTASFGPTLAPFSGSLVLADDGTGNTDDGCEALINGVDVNGKIAVIRRGDCNFTVKVKNAQDVGAIAVIMVNNIAGDPIPMGGEDATVTIPSVMLSMADGQLIIDQLGSGVNIDVSGFTSYAGYLATPGIQHVNDIEVRDIGSGNSEVYVAAGAVLCCNPAFSSLMGVQDFGIYKSIDEGLNWSKFDLPSSKGYDYQPNDIEIAIDNSIWIATTKNAYFGDGGGEILSSSDGLSFTLKHTVANGKRTQIAVSGINASTLYVLAELSSDTNGVKILHTDDGFVTATSLALPDDVSSVVPANDFTNGQAFYNLMLEIDPTNDAIVYVGGIDLFRSSDTGLNWAQISEAYSSTGLSDVHPDQHVMMFNPSDSNKAIFGNDGGVYYGSDLLAAVSSSGLISARNNNYNTVQFYSGAIGQEASAEKILGGTQDNGSLLINNASMGINSSFEVSGGDGAYTFIDKDNEYMISSIYYNRYIYLNYTSGSTIYTIDNDEDSGDFINPAALDSANNILYSNGSSGDTYQINRYTLSAGSAISDSFTDVLLDAAPSAFKMLSSDFWFKFMLVGTENGKLFHVKVNNSGSTWTDITGGAFTGSISCIETGITENDIYVTFYNYGIINIYYSADGGITWQNKEGDFPDIPVRAIMMNPLNASEVIIGTDLGVWGSPNFTDANPSWSQSNNGMKDVKVMSFDLRTSDNTVLAATYGRGMFTGQFKADDSSLSVETSTQNNLIKVYPTVSNGNIKISPIKNIRNGEVKIFDINGRIVYSSKINFDSNRAHSIALNVSSGMYVVKFLSENLIATHKIIIE